MIEQTTLEQPKTHHLSHQPSPVFACKNWQVSPNRTKVCGYPNAKPKHAAGTITAE